MRASVARVAALAATVAIAATGSAAAAPQLFTIDSASSTVDFRLRYLGLFTPGGRFSRVTGAIALDPTRPDSVAVTIQIPVDSLESRPEFWRSELLGPRFFDTNRYPVMEFHADHVPRTGPSGGEAAGRLTLHGVTGPVRLRAHVTASAGALEIAGETRISRSAFGLGATLPLASDQVTVTLRIRAVAAPEP